MKFVLLSDVHAKYKNSIGRKDNIGKTFESKLQYVFDYAQQHKCAILQAGDLNDKARDWDVLNFLIDTIRSHSVDFFCVYGQHDLYMRRDPDESPSVLSVLAKTNQFVHILNSDKTGYAGVDLYGSNWGEKIPYPENNNRKRILVLHAPISKRKEYPGHDYTSPEYFLKKHPAYHLVLVGDVHKKIYCKYQNRYLINTGPMLRVEATKYNMRHRPCFYVYNSEKHELIKEIIPHKPASDILTRDHIVQKNISTEELAEFTRTIKTMRPLDKGRRESVIRFSKELGNKRVTRIVKEVING
jgi:predicted phosphodiesterase